jgi:hypothetical protein
VTKPKKLIHPTNLIIGDDDEDDVSELDVDGDSRKFVKPVDI